MKKLKADFHIHTADDPYDRIRYSSKQLIERAQHRGYDILAITNHNTVTYNAELQEYAHQHGILLIPGVEATIEKKHVLLFNIDYSKERINTFADLRKAKTEDSLVIAPHPFFPSPLALQGKLKENLDLFDAIEYCHFYFSWLNFNKRGVQLARLYDIPLVGTSDTHFWWQFHTTYSLIEGKKTTSGVIQAIKQGMVTVVSSPLSLFTLGKMGMKLPLHLMADLIVYSGNLGSRWAEIKARKYNKL